MKRAQDDEFQRVVQDFMSKRSCPSTPFTNFEENDLERAIQNSMIDLPESVRRERELERFREKRLIELAAHQSVLIKTKEDWNNSLLRSSSPDLFNQLFYIREIAELIASFLPKVQDIIQLWRIFGYKKRLTSNYLFLVDFAIKQASIRYGITPTFLNPLYLHFKSKILLKPNPPPTPVYKPAMYLPKRNYIPPTTSVISARTNTTIEHQIENEFKTTNFARRGITNSYQSVQLEHCARFGIDLREIEEATMCHIMEQEIFLLSFKSCLINYKLKNFSYEMDTHCDMFTSLFKRDHLAIDLARKKAFRVRTLITLEHCTSHEQILQIFCAIRTLTVSNPTIFKGFGIYLWRIHKCSTGLKNLDPLSNVCLTRGCALGGILVAHQNQYYTLSTIYDHTMFGFL